MGAKTVHLIFGWVTIHLTLPGAKNPPPPPPPPHFGPCGFVELYDLKRIVYLGKSKSGTQLPTVSLPVIVPSFRLTASQAGDVRCTWACSTAIQCVALITKRVGWHLSPNFKSVLMCRTKCAVPVTARVDNNCRTREELQFINRSPHGLAIE